MKRWFLVFFIPFVYHVQQQCWFATTPKPSLSASCGRHRGCLDSRLGLRSKEGDRAQGSGASEAARIQLPHDRFGLQYTCGRCATRNVVSINRVAWSSGVVVATCRGCNVRHLLADSGGLLDLTNETGFKNVVEYAEGKKRTATLDSGPSAGSSTGGR